MQDLITGLLVVLAVAYAAWYWMPQRLRRHLGRVNQHLAEKTPQCGACNASCGSCGTTPSDSSAASSASGQTGKVPIWMKPQ